MVENTAQSKLFDDELTALLDDEDKFCSLTSSAARYVTHWSGPDTVYTNREDKYSPHCSVCAHVIRDGAVRSREGGGEFSGSNTLVWELMRRVVEFGTRCCQTLTSLVLAWYFMVFSFKVEDEKRFNLLDVYTHVLCNSCATNQTGIKGDNIKYIVDLIYRVQCMSFKNDEEDEEVEEDEGEELIDDDECERPMDCKRRKKKPKKRKKAPPKTDAARLNNFVKTFFKTNAKGCTAETMLLEHDTTVSCLYNNTGNVTVSVMMKTNPMDTRLLLSMDYYKKHMAKFISIDKFMSDDKDIRSLGQAGVSLEEINGEQRFYVKGAMSRLGEVVKKKIEMGHYEEEETSLLDELDALSKKGDALTASRFSLDASLNKPKVDDSMTVGYKHDKGEEESSGSEDDDGGFNTYGPSIKEKPAGVTFADAQRNIKKETNHINVTKDDVERMYEEISFWQRAHYPSIVRRAKNMIRLHNLVENGLQNFQGGLLGEVKSVLHGCVWCDLCLLYEVRCAIQDLVLQARNLMAMIGIPVQGSAVNDGSIVGKAHPANHHIRPCNNQNMKKSVMSGMTLLTRHRRGDLPVKDLYYGQRVSDRTIGNAKVLAAVYDPNNEENIKQNWKYATKPDYLGTFLKKHKQRVHAVENTKNVNTRVVLQYLTRGIGRYSEELFHVIPEGEEPSTYPRYTYNYNGPGVNYEALVSPSEIEMWVEKYPFMKPILEELTEQERKKDAGRQVKRTKEEIEARVLRDLYDHCDVKTNVHCGFNTRMSAIETDSYRLAMHKCLLPLYTRGLEALCSVNRNAEELTKMYINTMEAHNFTIYGVSSLLIRSNKRRQETAWDEMAPIQRNHVDLIERLKMK